MKKSQGARLKEVRKHFGYSQKKIGEVIGVSQAAWANAEKGLNNLKSSNLKKLEDELSINIEFIEKGTGEIILERSKKQEHSEIKLISGSVLAGLSNTSQIQEHSVEDTLYLPLGKNKQFYAIKVEGRSMEPKITEGSILILEEMKEKSDFTNNKIYVIIFQGIAFVKRVQMLLGGDNKGKFEVKSDNEDLKQIVLGDDITAWYKVTHVLNQM